MKFIRMLLVVLLLFAYLPASALAESDAGVDEIVAITSFDGVEFDGRLRLPAGETVDRLVIYVNGSGPNTYDNRRDGFDGTQFNYHDIFADELNARGVGYFSYNTRGVTPGEESPFYCEIDDELYKTYKPSNEIRDMAYIINRLKEYDQLKDAQIILLGWSAGAIVAPQAALAGEAQIDRLVLAGYPNDTMADILMWQQTGGSSMVFYRRYFDTDGDGVIAKAEYEADPNGLRAMLGDLPYDQLDMDVDGKLTQADFGEMLAERRELVFNAFENGDDEWLKNNYGVVLTSGWYLDYANIEPNATALPKLDLPIHIFQGEYDQNTSVEGARSAEKAFEQMGKDNLTVHYYEADHDLNLSEYLMGLGLPQPYVDMFDLCGSR